MEQFKASDEAWQVIELQAKERFGVAFVGLCDLRDRVAALEAKQAPGESPATAPAAPVVAVPSDQELWEVQLKVKSQSRPHIGWQVWSPESEPLIAAHRALYDHGYDHGYQQGLAAGRAEQQAAAEATPEPEPEPVHSQYFSGHGLIAGEIDRALAEGGWTPTPEPTPEPEPSPSPAAAEAGLVEEVLDAMGEGTEVEARKAICKVAARARAHDLNGMSPAAMTWEGVARWLEQEANR